MEHHPDGQIHLLQEIRGNERKNHQYGKEHILLHNAVHPLGKPYGIGNSRKIVLHKHHICSFHGHITAFSHGDAYRGCS